MNIKKITFLAIFAAIFLFSLYRLNGGIVLGEPDEVTHWEVMENFKKGIFKPTSSGGPWYYELPGLPFLGYLFSFFVPGRYTPLRVASLLGYWALGLGFYLWGKWRFSQRFGIIAAVSWLISPLAIFYGRIGVLDSGSVSFSFLSLLALDYTLKNKKVSFGILSGVFLALALYIKYSVLVYVLAFCSYFAMDLFRRNLPGFFKKETFSLNAPLFASLFSTFILVFPIFGLLFWNDRYLFRLHFLTNMSFITDEIRKASSAFNIFSYKEDLIWWLSWPLVLFILGGLFLLFRKYRKSLFTPAKLLFWLTFFLVSFALIRQKPFYPRYVLMGLPFAILLSSLFLDRMYSLLLKKAKENIILPVFLFLGASYFCFFTLPAWKSSQNNLVEETVAYLKRENSDKALVASNYWPHYFLDGGNNWKVAWLSADIRDATVYLPDAKKSSLDLIFQEGGYVLLEEKYSSYKTMVVNDAKKVAWGQIRKQLLPIIIIESTSPNFPYIRAAGNRVNIYKISKS